MGRLALVSPMRVSRTMTDSFSGYINAVRVPDGAFAGMRNLSGDAYPLISTRAKRGTVASLTAPRAILGKAALAYIDGTALYYAGADVTAYLTAKGFSISSAVPKTMVSMGSYLLIFPDKLYFNTADYTDCGSMEAHFTSTGTVSYAPSDADGGELSDMTVSPSAPTSPANGALWVDTSAVPHVLRRYSASSAVWVEVAAMYTRISASGIGAAFKANDAVTLSGCAVEASAAADEIAALNTTKVISARGDDFIVVPGLVDAACSQTAPVTAARTVPDMDFVIQAQNRLWGCRYGLENGRAVNEIYASALGDFKNFRRYTGLSGDSYAASVGSDGAFTGAAAYLGQPVFFKEGCLHKVYVSPYGAHQIVETACAGVEQGSGASIAEVGGALYYKSRRGVMRYDGSLPQSVSSALGDAAYSDAVAGALGGKYYISMLDDSGSAHLFVFDTRRALWYREDELRCTAFAALAGELYAITEEGKLIALGGSAGEKEQSISWSAETGILGYSSAEDKYLRCVRVRLRLGKGARALVAVEYDSSGRWETVGRLRGETSDTLTAYVRPRRCDHFRLRLTGEGDMTLLSIAKDTASE